MPDLGEGLEEGEIVSWLVAEGDEVDAEPNARRGRDGEDDRGDPVAVRRRDREASRRRRRRRGGRSTAGDVLRSRRRHPANEPVESSGSAEQATGSAAATPAVRRLAKDLGIDLATVTGTGPDGQGDRRRRGTRQRDAGADLGAPSGSRCRRSDERSRGGWSRRRRSRRSPRSEPWTRPPWRRSVPSSSVSPLPVFIAALCRTIAVHPILNAAWADDAIVVHSAVHAGIAVDTERGLFVPVIRDAGTRGRGRTCRGDPPPRRGRSRRFALARRSRRAPRSRSATRGATAARPAPPCSTRRTPSRSRSGVIEPRALVTGDGAVEARSACTISLTFDHRVLDGAAAGRALTDLVDLLEDADALRELPR